MDLQMVVHHQDMDLVMLGRIMKTTRARARARSKATAHGQGHIMSRPEHTNGRCRLRMMHGRTRIGHHLLQLHGQIRTLTRQTKQTEEEKRDALVAQEAACLLQATIKGFQSAIKGIDNPSVLSMKVPSTDFPSALNVMEADKKQYWIQSKRDGNGHTTDFCLLCGKFLTHDHIGYGSKSMHRTRRQDPGSYFPLKKLEPWKVEEARRMKQEDEDEEEGRKKDEAQRCVDADMALARQASGDIVEQAMISIPNPLAMTEEQAELVKAFVAHAANISLASGYPQSTGK